MPNIRRFFHKELRSSYLLASLSGLLIGGACVYYEAGWLILLAFVPLIEFLHRNRANRKRLILGSLLAGVISNAIIFSWIATVDLEWTNMTGWSEQFFAILIWVIASFVYSAGFPLIGWAVYLLRPFKNLWYVALLLPAIFTLGVYANSWSYALLFWSPHNIFGALTAIGNPGIPAAITPLGYLGRYIGLYGLCFVVILGSSLAWYSWRTRVFLPVAGYVAAGVMLTGAAYWLSAPSLGKELHVAVQQESSNSLTGVEGFKRQLSENPNPKPIDTLVLPEYSSLLQSNDAKATETFLSTFMNDNSSVIYGEAETKNNKSYNSISVADNTGKKLLSQQKSFLVPFGEYIPTIHAAFFRLLGFGSAVDNYSASRIIQKGTQGETPVKRPEATYGSLACSAITAPSLYRSLSRQGATILTSSSSLSFTKQDSVVHPVFKQMLHFESVANAKPMLSAGRGTHAYITDHNGKFLAQAGDITESKLLYGTVRPVAERTVYSKIGEWFIPLSVILVGAMVLYRKYPHMLSRTIKKPR